MKLHQALMAVAAAALLAACGDSSQYTPATPPAASNEVPASASASTMAYAQYANSLPKSETQAPLDVSRVTPPTSESEAPLAF